MWFGTTAGLSRLKQTSWTTYLSGMDVSGLLCLADGTLWVRTSQALHRFDGRDWEVTALKETPFPVIAGFQDSRGDVWIGTEGPGVWRHDGVRFHTYDVDDGLPHMNVQAIAEGPDGRLWFGTPGGACRYEVRSG